MGQPHQGSHPEAVDRAKDALDKLRDQGVEPDAVRFPFEPEPGMKDSAKGFALVFHGDNDSYAKTNRYDPDAGNAKFEPADGAEAVKKEAQSARDQSESDGDPGDESAADPIEDAPPKWLVDVPIPRDTTESRELYNRNPLFHGAVKSAARIHADDEHTQEGIDTVLRGELGHVLSVPISVIAGVGADPAETAEEMTKALRDATGH